MDIRHLSRRNENSFSKSDSFSLNCVEEVLRERIFLMGGDNDKFDLIEVL